MKTVEIILNQYAEETTDSNELQRAKQDGPLYIHSEGEFRIPHDGYEDEKLQLTFRLIGWPAKFKKPTAKKRGGIGAQEIPVVIEAWLEKFLGKAYMFNFKDHPNKGPKVIARRAALAVWFKAHGDGNTRTLSKELNTRTNSGMGNLQALDDLLFAVAKVEVVEPEPVEEPKHERWSIDNI